MDHAAYQSYLEKIVREAIAHSDGTNARISEYLWSLQVRGVFTPHKYEKQRALDEARRAFDEHRHWPQEIILSHLGVSLKEG